MPLAPGLPAVLAVVIAPVGVEAARPLARAATPATERRGGRDQRHQLADVVALARRLGEDHARTVSSTVPGVTEPDAPGPSPSPADTGPPDALPYAGQVVRRVLLRRNIAIDAETAQLVAAAVQAALQTGTG
jgi:hypothetical protein